MDILQVLAAYNPMQIGDYALTSETEKTFEYNGRNGSPEGEPAGDPVPEDDATSTSPPASQPTSTCTKCTPAAVIITPSLGEASPATSTTVKATTSNAASGTMNRRLRESRYSAAFGLFILACFLQT